MQPRSLYDGARIIRNREGQIRLAASDTSFIKDPSLEYVDFGFYLGNRWKLSTVISRLARGRSAESPLRVLEWNCREGRCLEELYDELSSTLPQREGIELMGYSWNSSTSWLERRKKTPFIFSTAEDLFRILPNRGIHLVYSFAGLSLMESKQDYLKKLSTKLAPGALVITSGYPHPNFIAEFLAAGFNILKRSATGVVFEWRPPVPKATPKKLPRRKRRGHRVTPMERRAQNGLSRLYRIQHERSLRLREEGNYAAAILSIRAAEKTATELAGPFSLQRAESALLHARLSNLTGQYAEAEKACRLATKIYRQHLPRHLEGLVASLVKLGDIHAHRGHLKTAINEYQEVIHWTENANTPTLKKYRYLALLSLAQIMIHWEKLEDAQDLVARASTNLPFSPTISAGLMAFGHWVQGELFMLNGQWRLAEDQLDHAISLYGQVLDPQAPLLARVILARAKLDFKRGLAGWGYENLNRAMAILESTVGINSLEYGQALFMRAKYNRSLPHNLDAAMEDLRCAQKIVEESNLDFQFLANIHRERAHIYAQKRDFAQAVEAMEDAVARHWGCYYSRLDPKLLSVIRDAEALYKEAGRRDLVEEMQEWERDIRSRIT